MSQSDLENKIMKEITSGRVKLRSKYIFLAEKLGLGSAFILTVLLAILFFSLVLFYLKTSDNIGYLSFGSRGFLAFLESFPYFLVVVFIILILFAGLVMKKSGMLYQKPFGYLALALIGFVMITGFSLASSRVMEKIESETFNNKPAGMFFKPFLRGAMQDRDWGVVGRVIEKDESFIYIQTPKGVARIELKELATPLSFSVAIGDFIIAVGERKDGFFKPQELRLMDSEAMPMIRRGIHRRFGFPVTSTLFNEQLNNQK